MKLVSSECAPTGGLALIYDADATHSCCRCSSAKAARSLPRPLRRAARDSELMFQDKIVYTDGGYHVGVVSVLYNWQRTRDYIGGDLSRL